MFGQLKGKALLKNLFKVIVYLQDVKFIKLNSLLFIDIYL